MLLVGLGVGLGISASGGSESPNGAGVKLVTLSKGETSAIWAGNSRAGWLADDTSGEVRQFSTRSGHYEGAPVKVGRAPVALAGGYGSLWVASSLANTVSRVSLASGRLAGATRVPSDPVSVATGAGGVWVASLLGGKVTLIDPATGQVERSFTTEEAPVRVVTANGSAWVTGTTDSLMRIRPGGQVRSVVVGNGPLGLAAGRHRVYVACAQSKTVVEVAMRTMRVTRTLHVGGDPVAVALWRGGLWVADGTAATIREYDPGTGSALTKPIDLPGTPRGLYTGAGHLWVAIARPSGVIRLSA